MPVNVRWYCYMAGYFCDPAIWLYLFGVTTVWQCGDTFLVILQNCSRFVSVPQYGSIFSMVLQYGGTAVWWYIFGSTTI